MKELLGVGRQNYVSQTERGRPVITNEQITERANERIVFKNFKYQFLKYQKTDSNKFWNNSTVPNTEMKNH